MMDGNKNFVFLSKKLNCVMAQLSPSGERSEVSGSAYRHSESTYTAPSPKIMYKKLLHNSDSNEMKMIWSDTPNNTEG